MDAATENLVLSQVQRELDAEVSYQKMRLFDTRKLTRDQIVKQIEEGDREAGTDQHTTTWHGEVMEVDWPAANLAKIDQITQTVTETKRDGSTKTTTTTTRPSPMSVSGLAPGMLQAKLAELRQRGQDRLAQGVAKIEGAHTAGLAKIDAAADDAIQKIDSEIDSALHEFAQSTNGGPA